MLLGEKSQFKISPQNGSFYELLKNTGFKLTPQILESFRDTPENGLILTLQVTTHEPREIENLTKIQDCHILPMGRKYIVASEMKAKGDQFFKTGSFKSAINAYKGIVGMLKFEEGQT